MSTIKDLKSTAKKVTDSEITKKLQDSANNIFQAGIGALAKQQEESSKVFSALVQQGQELESLTKDAVKKSLSEAEERVGEVKRVAQDKVSEVREKATVSIDKIETAVQDGVNQAIQQVNAATSEHVTKLNRRISELEGALEKLEKKIKKSN